VTHSNFHAVNVFIPKFTLISSFNTTQFIYFNTLLIRFLVVELNHSGLNCRFDMRVIFTANYSFSGR
jgi:hypothetical protein